jgi:hypothetical protein
MDKLSLPVNQKIKYASLSAVITRADGTVIDLGVITDTGFKNRMKSLYKRIFNRDYKNGITIYGS